MEDFGIVIGTYQRDYFMARACCASVRYFMPDVPLCLLVDGDFPTTDLQKAYGAKTLYRGDLKDPFLRQVSTGYGWPKLCLLWESPFERFLYLDADTVVWGDIRSKCALDEAWDVRSDEHSHYNPEEATVPRPWPPIEGEPDEVLRPYVGQWFFDTEKLEAHFPDFPWRRYVDQYFTAGIYAARRDTLPLREYQELYLFCESHPNVFKFGDQGLTNFLFLRAAHEGRIEATRVPWQTESGRITYAAKRDRFQVSADNLPIPSAEPWIIHYTDYKPTVAHRVSGRPMNYFRQRAQQEVYGRIGLSAMTSLQMEDARFMGWKNVARRIVGRIKIHEPD